MRPSVALHTLHALASVVLVATGALIELPELRSRLVGGYGLELAQAHRWATVVFVCVPLLILLRSLAPLYSNLAFRLRSPGGLSFRKLHLLASLFLSVFLSITGALIWLPDLASRLADPVLDSHVWVGWLFAAVIPIHVIASRRRIALRLRLWIRAGWWAAGRSPSADEVENDGI